MDTDRVKQPCNSNNQVVRHQNLKIGHVLEGRSGELKNIYIINIDYASDLIKFIVKGKYIRRKGKSNR